MQKPLPLSKLLTLSRELTFVTLPELSGTFSDFSSHTVTFAQEQFIETMLKFKMFFFVKPNHFNIRFNKFVYFKKNM